MSIDGLEVGIDRVRGPPEISRNFLPRPAGHQQGDNSLSYRRPGQQLRQAGECQTIPFLKHHWTIAPHEMCLSLQPFQNRRGREQIVIPIVPPTWGVAHYTPAYQSFRSNAITGFDSGGWTVSAYVHRRR
jgi:hypothetical protein